MFSASFKTDIRTWYLKKDGTSEIFLQVLINSQKKMIGLGIYWPVEKFDRKSGLCLRLHAKDTIWSDYNLIIREAIGRANDIITFYRLSGRSLSIVDFEREYGAYFNKSSFIAYFEHKLQERLSKGLIAANTHRSQKYSLGILKKISPQLSFAQLNTQTIQELDTMMMRKLKLTDVNTRAGRHKDFRCYINLAIKEGYANINPYDDFRVTKAPGKWYALTRDQYEVLHSYYLSPEINPLHLRSLRRFLFSCHTGLRISDLLRIDYDWLVGDTLVFEPKKTRRYGKLLKLPLSRFARELFDQEYEEHGDDMFKRPTEQKSNEALKAISKATGLNIRLHHHMARETFATLYLEFGGRLEVLKEYLAHGDIKTTMKYVHISQQRKRDEIARMDNLGNPTKETTRVVRL